MHWQCPSTRRSIQISQRKKHSKLVADITHAKALLRIHISFTFGGQNIWKIVGFAEVMLEGSAGSQNDVCSPSLSVSPFTLNNLQLHSRHTD